jgi:AcrR family transcriptional regulator
MNQGSVTRVTHRELLLDAARHCLETKGYARTTARDLVAASGTNLASIGYHFGSKEALLNEAIATAFAAWTDEVNRAVRETPADAPIERLLEGWREMLSRTEANRPLIVANLEAMAQIARSPDLRERMAAAYQTCREKIAEVVEESLPPDAGVDAHVIASFIIAVVDGITLQHMADPGRAPGGDQLVEALSRSVIAILATLPR